jgi:Integrase core domain
VITRATISWPLSPLPLAAAGYLQGSIAANQLFGSFKCLQISLALLGLGAEAGVAGFGDGGGAVGDLELGEDRRDVVAYRLFGQDEAPGDLVLAQTDGDEVEDFAFPRGEVGEDLRGIGLVGAREEGHDAPGHAGGVDGVAGGPSCWRGFGRLCPRSINKAAAAGPWTNCSRWHRRVAANGNAGHGSNASGRPPSANAPLLGQRTQRVYKTELINPNKPWKTAEEVEIATLHYVDWFNNTRLYEENGDIPPVELEQAYYRQHRPSA